MTTPELSVEPHPSLRISAFTSRFPAPLAAIPTPDALLDLLRAGARTPFTPDDQLRTDIRAVLRYGGYKPTGRGKPASEYLLQIDLAGLLCLFDADGPCANAVRDSHRTKTAGTTTSTLSVVWGATAHAERLTAATRWYRSLVESTGATTEPVG